MNLPPACRDMGTDVRMTCLARIITLALHDTDSSRTVIEEEVEEEEDEAEER